MSRLREVMTLALALTACVDVPEPAVPSDAAALDRGRDAVGEPEPDAEPEPEPDAAAEPEPDADRDAVAEPEPDADLDAALEPEPDVAEPDVGEPDMGPPAPGCLAPLGGGADHAPCLEVFAAAELPAARVRAAGATVYAQVGLPQVVISGGHLPGPLAEATAETWIYDPVDDRWSRGGDLRRARWGHTAAVDRQGSLVVAGGAQGLDASAVWRALAFAERYEDRAWRTIDGQLAPARSDLALAPLGPDRVLAIGGRVSSLGAPLDALDALTSAGVLPGRPIGIARVEPAVAPLPDGRILVVGGRAPDDQTRGIAELIRDDGAESVLLATRVAGGQGSGATPLSDGALIVGGATSADPEGSAGAWRYHHPLRRFERLPDMAAARLRPTVNPIGPPDSDWRLVVGGDEQGLVEVYDPVADRLWAFRLPAPWDHPRALHVAADFELDGRVEVLVVGGERPRALPDDGLLVVDVLRFRLTPPLVEPAPPPLPDGCLEIENPDGLPAGDLPCLRVRRGPPLPDPVAEPALVVAPSGQLVLTGGYDPRGDVGATRGTARLDPAGRVWRVGPLLTTARWGHVAVVAGGVWDATRIGVYGGATGPGDGTTFEATGRIESWETDQAGWQAAETEIEPARARGMAFVPQASSARWLVGGQSSHDGPGVGNGDFVQGANVFPMPSRLGAGRVDGAGCLMAGGDEELAGGGLVAFGGHDGQALVATAEFAPAQGLEWQPIAAELRPHSGSVCIGHALSVDLLGGREGPGRQPTNHWQRLEYADGAFAARAMRPLGRMRTRATVGAIGEGQHDSQAWLVVGGEDPGDQASPAVDLLFPLVGDVGRRQFTVRLPEGVGLRRGHAAASRPVYDRLGGDLLFSDVVVVGGLDVDGQPLDETLIFSLDPYSPPGAVGEPGPDPQD